ncbi:MAG: VOC family protein [Pseudomonadota bacterium]
MTLGAFSLSLAVKDLAASRAFYEKLGLKTMGGDPDQGWLILKGPTCVVGLFQNMFEKNMLTFNPGWDQNAQEVKDFEDVRDIQKRLKAEGIEFTQEADETTDGPASFVVVDPDGNPVLVDQHVPRPGRP